MSEPRDAPPLDLLRVGPRSFRTKIVASTVALMAAAVVVMGIGIEVVLNHTATRDLDRVLEGRADAMVAVVDESSGSAVRVPAEALEPGVQVFDGQGRAVAGSMAPVAQETAQRLGAGGVQRTAVAGEDEVRLLAVPFTTAGGATGVVVVSEDTRPYERSERYALLATGALGLIVVVGSAVIALRVTQQALRPVTRMAETAADWSEHDLDRRFDVGPPTDELAALAQILDQLLDRVASVILAEQRLTAELAHELRTPLTSIKGSADLALLRGVDDPEVRQELEQISASAVTMAGVITALLDVSRGAPGGAADQTCLAEEVLTDVADGVGPSTPDGVHVSIRPGGSTARIVGPAELVVRAVLPVAENAVRHARDGVVLSARDLPDRVELTVTDDGAGIDAALADTVFEPGVSTHDGGAGLGLGIARRVARSLGGDVRIDGTGHPGATFVVSLPRRA